ncbi:uncharacterized protein LOC112590344 [Harpegnathos saltator]|uniref:uncharacterized protein LOC112590344 n=1 Tax=Harpegnathos saltator TaxID=610380 RepID=UPI000DBEE607|nr:uncharacterized protein LOC112590344 [Harpegnathos saltator]
MRREACASASASASPAARWAAGPGKARRGEARQSARTRTQGALTTKISENYHRRRCHQYGGQERRRCRAVPPRAVWSRSISLAVLGRSAGEPSRKLTVCHRTKQLRVQRVSTSSRKDSKFSLTWSKLTIVRVRALCKRQYGRSNCEGSNAALCCALQLRIATPRVTRVFTLRDSCLWYFRVPSPGLPLLIPV